MKPTALSNKQMELSRILPKEWRFCKVGSEKRPYEKNWPSRPYGIVRVLRAFFDPSTKCKAIGVLCGSSSNGLVCLDVDGPKAIKKLQALERENSRLPETVTWTSGKEHRYQKAFWVYEEDWNEIRTTHLLKGDEELTLKWDRQQSVIYGQHPETGSYKWLPGKSPADIEVAIAPDWLVDLMRVPIRKTTVDVEGDPLLEGEHLKAKEALELIPVKVAEDYHEWLRVGMALKAVSERTEVDLFDEWVDWSEQAYNACTAAEYEAKWESFERDPNDSGSVGIGTLIMLANEHDQFEEIEDEKPVVNFSKEEVENWVYVASEAKYCHRNCPDTLYTSTGFQKAMMLNGVPKAIKKVRKTVDLVNWYPGKKKIYIDKGQVILNRHDTYPVGKPGNVSMFVELVKRLFPREASHIFDFMAFTVQNPGQKINHALYMVGNQGIGKNFIWEPIKWALGHEFSIVRSAFVSSKYNDFALGRKMVIIDEPMNINDSRVAMANELKTLVAATGEDEPLLIDGKYRVPVNQVNLTNYAILTNFPDAIRITNERRFYPCFSDAEPDGPEFFNQFARWLANDGCANVIHWLHQRDLSGFDVKATPIPTESYQDIAMESRSELSDILDDFITQHEAVTFHECYRAIKDINGKVSHSTCKRIIEELGHKTTGKRDRKIITIKGERTKFNVVHVAKLNRNRAEVKLKNYWKKHGQPPKSVNSSMFD